jgi:hypothetical protein
MLLLTATKVDKNRKSAFIASNEQMMIVEDEA